MSTPTVLLYSDDETQGKSMLSYRNPSETQLLLSPELLTASLSETPACSLTLFQAFLSKPLQITLKTWAVLYTKLKPAGFVKLGFSAISQEEFLQLSKMLKANGFVNKDPLSGSLSNELIYAKPEKTGEKPQENSSNSIEKSQQSSGILGNKEVCGEFAYNKLVEVDLNKKKLYEEGEIIDEDDLLRNETGYTPFAKNQGSCETKPKACKNCTCGRKALEFNQYFLLIFHNFS